MALVLKIKTGEAIYIDDERLDIVTVECTPNVKVRRADGTVFTISEDRSAEVFPAVKITLSRPPGASSAHLSVRSSARPVWVAPCYSIVLLALPEALGHPSSRLS
jgi:hypothetical protein